MIAWINRWTLTAGVIVLGVLALTAVPVLTFVVRQPAVALADKPRIFRGDPFARSARPQLTRADVGSFAVDGVRLQDRQGNLANFAFHLRRVGAASPYPTLVLTTLDANARVLRRLSYAADQYHRVDAGDSAACSLVVELSATETHVTIAVGTVTPLPDVPGVGQTSPQDMLSS